MHTTNEVLAERLEGLKTFINERFDENSRDHERVTQKLDYTNGKVRRHEKIFYGVYGGFAVLSSLVIPVLIYFINTKLIGK